VGTGMSNDKTYDYIIIGGGPAGVACAQLLSDHGNNSVAIIDNGRSLGGCHRVVRHEGYFTEHGPRIYTGAYVNFKALLQEAGLDFYDLFVEYEYNVINLSRLFLTEFAPYEMGVLTLEFLKYIVNTNHGRDISLRSVARDFSENGQSLIDRICRTIDGGTIDTYSINKFIRGVDDNVFYTFYQPRQPNDKGLFKVWGDVLRHRGVDIFLNRQVDTIAVGSETVTVRAAGGELTLFGRNVIMATPPRHMHELLLRSGLRDVFVNERQMKDWVKRTDYIRYITITYHWDSALDVPHQNRLGDTDWAISDIKLSHYMKNINTDNSVDAKGEFVISAAVVYLDKVSKHTGKTADESTEEELIAETFRQIGERIGQPIMMYDRAFINPNVKKIDGIWMDTDTAFVNTYDNPLPTFPFRSHRYPNVFNVGTHNNIVHYHYTSLESALTNSIMLCNTLTPTPFPIRSSVKLSSVLQIVIVLLLVVIVIRNSN
jgi:uncharacterized protein with NAD-binding domain and iron-sulfur cluster